MSAYTATICWLRGSSEAFIDNKYSRGHQWIFDGGITVPASSSPTVVPLPYSVEQNVDPEEAYIASLSSCHMLFFLSIAAKKRFVVDEYVDNPIGIVAKDQQGKFSVTKVTLRPKVRFSGEKQPSLDELNKIHDQSHDQCFISNSVKTEVVTEIVN